MRLAVLDTNIIVSAAIKPGSAPAQLVMDWVLEGQILQPPGARLSGWLRRLSWEDYASGLINPSFKAQIPSAILSFITCRLNHKLAGSPFKELSDLVGPRTPLVADEEIAGS
ncbi:MAG TPA: hypothetical protein VK638_46130 [Edaphobacter sp.]|nr:hypothetical protein [Edaphobacter sp.]